MSLKLESKSNDLSDKQKDSVFILTALSDCKKIPEKFLGNSENTLNDNSTTKYQLSIKFLNLLDKIEKDNENCLNETENNKAINDLKTNKKICDDLYLEVVKCIEKTHYLKGQYISTSNKTNALHGACEHLLSDQNKLIEKSKEVDENLRYFITVDNLAMKVSFPNLKATVENLEPILNQIDDCFKFLSSKTHYSEGESYLNKLIDSLWKILNKISSHFTQEIDNTFAQFADKTEISQDKSFTILYGKFRSQGIKIRPFVELISSRKHVCDIYSQVFEECEKHYIYKREQLLTRVINCSIDDLMAKFPKDHCTFIRSGGTLMIRMCDDETNLYQQFFVNSDHQLLKNMLTNLCGILYEAFRPSIIHINHLETLAEICSIVKVELIEDCSVKSNLDNSPIDIVCQMILADVQERLVFRTHIYIKSQILGYVPCVGDLSYPEKLEMMIAIAESMKGNWVDFQNGTNSPNESPNPDGKLTNTPNLRGDIFVNPGPNMSLSPADLHGMWYPTVRRTLVSLSKLHRCLDLVTFQGLAQDCVEQCVQSLVNAADLIGKQKSIMDSQLFLIKHLLILREQVAPFNVEFTVKETSLGFNNIRNAAVGLLSSRSQILALNRSNSLLRFLLETPDVIETVVDSRHQLDGQLKSICDQFISNCIMILVGPLNEFLQKVSTIESISSEGNIHVKVVDQPFTEISKIQELLSKSYRELSPYGKYVQIKRSLHLYLSNPDTELILLKPIKAGIIKAYRSFQYFLTKYFSEEDCQIVVCPSEKQVSLQLEINFDGI